MRKYDAEGRLLLTLGEFGRAGNDEKHFDRPTDVTVLPNGEIYVTDGYGNRRVVRFDAAGRYIAQWGQAGTGPGQFAPPHAIVADSRIRLYVADRENARIQVFDRDGKLLDVWANRVSESRNSRANRDRPLVAGLPKREISRLGAPSDAVRRYLRLPWGCLKIKIAIKICSYEHTTNRGETKRGRARE